MVKKVVFVSAIVFCFCLTLRAQSIIELIGKSGVKGGLIVHAARNCSQSLGELPLPARFVFQGFYRLDSGLDGVRKRLIGRGVYGRISVSVLHTDTLPVVNDLINLLVEDDRSMFSEKDILRALAPNGKAYIKEAGGYKEIIKPWPSGMDQWTHYLHGPGNNAVAADEKIGPPRSLQWIMGPRWGRSHEELASMSVSVSANGRIFFICDVAPLESIRFDSQWKLIARDAFNGTNLWSKPIPNWIDCLRHFRSGPAYLPRRLVAVGDRVYVTLGLSAPVSVLDAATGKLLHVYKGTEHTEEIVVCNKSGAGHPASSGPFNIYLMVGTSEISRFGRGLFDRGEPEATKKRFILALDEATGRELWRRNARDADYVLPLSLTAKGGKVFYHGIKGLFCVDAETGKEKWMVERPTVAKRYAYSTSTLVVADDVVLLADRRVDSKQDKKFGAAKGNINYAVNGWNEGAIARHGTSELTAYSTEDGRKLWVAPCREGYNSPVDVFVVKNTVWLGTQFSKGYDLHTGKVVKELDVRAHQVGMAHHRCYRDKASYNFILTGHDGIETIDLNKGWTGNNSWIRGTCQYGILPANGLLYAPPNACACHPKVKMQGYVAVSSKIPEQVKKDPSDPETRLVKGPAFGRLDKLTALDKSISPDAWPMYRHDNMRSGSVKTIVMPELKKWTASIGGRLTQPVAGHNLVYVASIDTHTVYALNGDTGDKLWSFTAGARIDSAPALFRGLVVFGSNDGQVYCLDGANGELAYRFRAAPAERMIAVFNQLESAWPVQGAVLVQNNELFFTAGHNTYLDGGIYFYRMNPCTGRILSWHPIRFLDPVTGRQTGKEGSRQGLGFDSEGTCNDVLSGDGSSIFLKHMRFDCYGNEEPLTVPHLFCQTGFLGEEWFVRSYWLYGTNVGAGWGRWASMKSNNVKIAPAGRIISFDDVHAYGYGRINRFSGAVGHRAEATQLFCSVKVYPPIKKQPALQGKKRAKGRVKQYIWSNKNPFMVRAMVLADNALYIAGVPDIGKRNKSILSFLNDQEELDAFHGKKGAFLRTVSKDSGKKTAEIKLEAPPVFDGMSAARGRLFISLKNGDVICMGR